MEISRLSLVNFKNYSQAEIAFHNGINCLLGNNGQGKTNVLDAIHILSFCKSYFNPIDSQSIKIGEEFYMVEGTIHKDESDDLVQCSVKKGRKKLFKRNKAEYERLADHIGRYPVVMITPYDTNLILEGSDVRRRFMDSIISQYDRDYLQHLIAYNRILDQRNSYLKSAEKVDLEMINTFDDQLVQFGSVISTKRQEFTDEVLQKYFPKFYKRVAGKMEDVNLMYHSQVTPESFEYKLKESFEKDRATRYTNVGTHKDDVVFRIGDYALKKFGSQGQQKSYLIALKLAYYKCVVDKIGIKPILLLDDIFDKLDQDRVMALLDIVTSEEVGQVFITDTSTTEVPKILEEINADHRVYHVKNGSLNEA